MVCTNKKFYMFIIVKYHYNDLSTIHTSQLSIIWTLAKWWSRASNRVYNQTELVLQLSLNFEGKRKNGSIERWSMGQCSKCHVVTVEIISSSTQLEWYEAINVWIIPRRYYWFPTICLCQHKLFTPNSHPSFLNSF